MINQKGLDILDAGKSAKELFSNGYFLSLLTRIDSGINSAILKSDVSDSKTLAVLVLRKQLWSELLAMIKKDIDYGEDVEKAVQSDQDKRSTKEQEEALPASRY